MTTVNAENTASIAIGAAVALVAALACTLCYQFKKEHRIHPTTILWALPFLASEILVAVWNVMGICWADISSLNLHADVTCICGIVTMLRRPIFNLLDRAEGHFAPFAIRLVRDLLAMGAAAVISVVSLETACNTAQIEKIPFAFFWVSVAIVFIIMLLLYFIGQRTGALCWLAVVTCCGLGIAQHFVIKFKGTALLPSDLLAIQTAAAVSDGYTFTFNSNIVTSLAWAAVGVMLLSFMSPARPRRKRYIAVNVAVNLVCALIVWSGATAAFADYKLEDELDFAYDRWWPINSYRTYGFIPVFTASAQNFEIEKPDNYTTENAEAIQTELAAQYDAGRGSSAERQAAVAQYNELKPTVITVMNETFTDLSFFDALRDAGYNGPSYYNSISDALVRGTLYASITGGGTANTEFEYLTNDSLAFIGSGKYPYSLYNLTNVDSLAKQLESQGYATHAMHPNLPDNWNRRTSYNRLGFSTFDDIDSFEGAPTYHSGVTDGATYEKILEYLDSDDDSQFILDVTMQNHGGYGLGSVPDEDLTSYQVAGLSDDTNASMNVYLTCIEKADQDLQWFMDQLRQIDRPVVLVFFGDHQPTVSTSMNDELYQNEDSFAHTARVYDSTYFVWANYDVAGCEQISTNETIGASELSARVLDLIGAPLTDYQKALLATRSSIPAFSGCKYLGADGVVYELTDKQSEYAAVIDQIRRMQYLNFVEKL